MKRMHEFTCIVCPLSCEVKMIEDDGEVLEIEGGCKKGNEYALSEFINPLRTLTTTVRVENGSLPVLPVRSEKPISKKLMKKCIKELAEVEVKAPIKHGVVIYENILNAGVNIIASRDLERRNYGK